MCTVTFIPGRQEIFLTSNRDEKHWRQDAAIPIAYNVSSGKVMFPKDPDAGGTWIAVHENGNAIVFLNGGNVAHEPKPPYRKSRGLVLLDFIEQHSPFGTFLATTLEMIEPFTAVIWDSKRLYECRWDGTQKYSTELDSRVPHIWSSVTLYDKETIAKRNAWFAEWLLKNGSPKQEEILHFHQFTGDGDSHNDLRMNRNGRVFTVSVTSLAIGADKADIHYLDLKNNQRTEDSLFFEKTMGCH